MGLQRVGHDWATSTFTLDIQVNTHHLLLFCAVQSRSVAELCLTLCYSYGLQHTRLACLSPSPRVCPSSCPLSLSSHCILCCPLLLLHAIFPSIRVFSTESALHIRWPDTSLALSLLYGPTLTPIHDYWKNRSFDYTDFVGKVISLLFNIMSRFVIVFLPRSKHLLISWLQSPSAVILEPKKIKSDSFHCFPIYFPWKDGTRCHDLHFLHSPLSLSRGFLVPLHFLP